MEAEILVNRDSLRELCVQQQVDAALKALLDPGKAQLEAAILASVHGLSNEAVEAKVLAQTVRTPSVDAGAQAGSEAKRGRRDRRMVAGARARKSGSDWWGWLSWGLAGGLALWFWDWSGCGGRAGSAAARRGRKWLRDAWSRNFWIVVGPPDRFSQSRARCSQPIRWHWNRE